MKNVYSLVATILLISLYHSPAWAQNEISTPYLTSAKNFRDIAGISITYGGTGFANDTSHNGIMRTGVFYRSSELGGLNSNDLVTLSNLGISRVMDLRTPSEILASPEVHLNGASEVNFNIFGTYKSVTTGKAGGLKDCEPLKAVYSTDSLTTIRWSTI
ncbi:tyrosine-protein phosphatase [uncultured Desulfobulbus sp.]|uniref:tyrosine-protein phosphatase n=1 Tax=uncultured Desulfobulbus sp. TaxID=239745 RepID=UPI0029C83229|nr:tyrosine-protein phosphatase [uncultured Desulfobulbus sp.]